MKTIRRFFNIAEAGFACSVLEAAGIRAVLADDLAYTLGPQYVPWGIRLQVPDSDVERAQEIIERQEGFTPLPDDFVPPDEPHEDAATPSSKPGYARAFIKGGLWTLVAFGFFAAVCVACGGSAHADRGGVLILFILGGILGLIIRAFSTKAGESGDKPKGLNFPTILITLVSLAGLYIVSFYFLLVSGNFKLIGRDRHLPDGATWQLLYGPMIQAERQRDLWRTEMALRGTWHLRENPNTTLTIDLPAFHVAILRITSERGISEPLFRDMRHHLYRTNELVFKSGDDVLMIPTDNSQILLMTKDIHGKTVTQTFLKR